MSSFFIFAAVAIGITIYFVKKNNKKGENE